MSRPNYPTHRLWAMNVWVQVGRNMPTGANGHTNLMVEAMVPGRDFTLNKSSEKPEKWLIHIDSLFFRQLGCLSRLSHPLFCLTDMDMFWPSSAVDQDGTLLVAFEVQGGREDRALSLSPYPSWGSSLSWGSGYPGSPWWRLIAGVWRCSSP